MNLLVNSIMQAHVSISRGYPPAILNPSPLVILNQAKNLPFAEFLVGSGLRLKYTNHSLGIARISMLFNAVSPAEKVIRTIVSITLIRVIIYVMLGIQA